LKLLIIIMDKIEHLNEVSYYRKFVSIIYSHSTTPLIYSLISGYIGSFVEFSNPLYGFVVYAWTFLILYILIVGAYVYIN